MSKAKNISRSSENQLPKSPTGIAGLDEITHGGLPKGRPTLVCGGAGSGNTLLGIEFLVRGATQYNEPGVFMSFEESAEELTKHVASLGLHLNRLIASKRLLVDYVHIERSEIEETGEYDLEGLFIRLAMRLIPLVQKESFSIRLNRSLRGCPMLPSSGQNFVVSFVG